MSQAWRFPSPHGEPPWPGWTLSTTAGWALAALDPKLLMRLAPELAERLAALEPHDAPGGDVYVVWQEEPALREA